MKYTCKRTLTKATSFQTCIDWYAKISFKQDPTDAEIGQLLQKLAASVYDPYASQERSNSLELRTFVWKIAISVEFFQCLLRPTLARPAGLERIANRFARIKLKSNNMQTHMGLKPATGHQTTRPHGQEGEGVCAQSTQKNVYAKGFWIPRRAKTC